MTTHNLKTVQPFFDAVVDGSKRFEIRKNDRNFARGDLVNLMEFEGEKLTGRNIYFRIGFITDFEQHPGYVVFSLLPL